LVDIFQNPAGNFSDFTLCAIGDCSQPASQISIFLNPKPFSIKADISASAKLSDGLSKKQKKQKQIKPTLYS
jgi:hypothetical protein